MSVQCNLLNSEKSRGYNSAENRNLKTDISCRVHRPYSSLRQPPSRLSLTSTLSLHDACSLFPPAIKN